MAEETTKTPAKSETKKTANLFIIGLFAFLITIIISATVLVVILRTPPPQPAAQVVSNRESSGESRDEIGALIPISPEIIVNIMSESGERYLKVNLVVEIPDGKGREKIAAMIEEEVTKRIPQFRDAIISILRTKTKEEIDEKEGKDLIRKEIINTINNFLISGKIKNIYFQDFVIQ